MDTDTDKNAWPTFVMLFGSAVSLMVLAFAMENKLLMLLYAYVLILGFSSFAMLLSLCFSKTLKPVSFYKKLVICLCPFMLFSSRFRYWTVKELSPTTTYEEFLRITNRERNT